MKEKEYKFLLSKEKFIEVKKTISCICNSITPILQINYYYDDEQNSLYKQDITLRIHQTGELLELQRKRHIIKSNSWVESDETNIIITSLPKIIDNKYRLKGSLVTMRCRMKIEKSSILFDFDENYYLGESDYELEMEIENESDKQVESIYTLFSEFK